MQQKNTRSRKSRVFAPWIAIYALCMSWLFAVPFYDEPRLWASVALVALAVIFMWPLSAERAADRPSRRDFLWALAAVPAVVVLPGLYRTVPILLIASVVIRSLRPGAKLARSTSSALFACVWVLLWQLPVEKAYDFFAARYHDAPVFDVLLHRITSFFGIPASLSDGTVYVQTMRALEPVTVTWEKLGILPLMYMTAGAAGFLFLFEPGRRLVRFALFLGLAAGYAVVRGVFMILLFHTLSFFTPYESVYNFATIFWNPVVLALTFLPLPFLLEAVDPLAVAGPRAPSAEEGEVTTRRLRFRRHAPAILCGAGVFLAIGAYGFHDPGLIKEGRVLVDTGHSEWELVDQPYDTTWYGPDSGYNYYCITDYLRHFYDVTHSDTTITADLLADFDVLIVKIPTTEFDPEEVATIKAFVEDGGGLFLIGDHTNVFGSGVYLNDIAREFGFQYRFDCLFDVKTIFEELYFPPAALRHPILREVPHILFQTSCSIAPLSPAGTAVINGDRLKSRDIDYSSDNFYPPVDDTPAMKFGPFVQMVVKHHGRGRVAGFTDSTILSNFSAFLPGTSEMFLHTVDWLNRKNRYQWLNLAMGIAGGLLIAAGLGVAATRRPKPKEQTQFVAGILLAAAAGIAAFHYVGNAGYGAVVPKERPTTVVFDLQHCRHHVPIYGHLKAPLDNYSIFYQWILRLGYFPHVHLTGDVTRGDPDLVVMIEPDKLPSPSEREAIAAYVRSGGSLLVIDGPSNAASVSNAFLSDFDLRFVPDPPVKTAAFLSVEGDTLAHAPRAFRCSGIRGGRPLYLSETQEPIGATVPYGKGSVTAIGFARLFSDLYMGREQSVYPDESLRARYSLEFDLVRRTTEGDAR